MAFKASAVIPKDAFDNIRRQAVVTKNYLTGRRTAMEQPTCPADVVLSIVQHCASTLDLLAAWASVPGLAAYAKIQVDDPLYDVAAEYVAMRDALAALRDNLIAMFPKDASQFLLYQTFLPDGQLAVRTFTTAQLAAVVVLVTATLATID